MRKGKTRCNKCIHANVKGTDGACRSCSEIQMVGKMQDNFEEVK